MGINAMGIKEWYVLYTREGNELKLSDTLTKKGYTTYIPLSYTSDGKTQALKPAIVFKRFLFICCTTADIAPIKKVPGVEGCLYWLKQPVALTQSEMESLKIFTEKNRDIVVEFDHHQNVSYMSELPYNYHPNGRQCLVLDKLKVKLSGNSGLRVLFDHSTSMNSVVA